MTSLSSRFSPEGISSVVIGLTAGFTSTLLTGWATVSDLGRAIIFVGSTLSGTLFAYWASRASGPGAAVGKSTVGGGLQANISATALLYVAWKFDMLLGLATRPSPPSDFGGYAIIILIIGTIVGCTVGMLYAFVPALVAHWRKTPRLGNEERAMYAASGFAMFAALAHASIAKDWAAWAPLTVLALAVAATAFIRTTRRNAFLGRVRAGEEPRYRIEPAEGRSVLYRIAEEDEREILYRENAPPRPEPKAIGVL